MAVFGCQTSSPRAPHTFACLKLIAWLVMVVVVVVAAVGGGRCVAERYPSCHSSTSRPPEPVQWDKTPPAPRETDTRRWSMQPSGQGSFQKSGASSDAKCHHPHVYDRIRLDGRTARNLSQSPLDPLCLHARAQLFDAWSCQSFCLRGTLLQIDRFHACRVFNASA